VTASGFIARWARLKQRNDATIVRPPPETAAEEPFDVASLPSIESIVADTDISAFLQSRVPAELARAALRQAWTRDPAIRDFIGIADNQWDFNDPTAIPGFGPLCEGDDLPKLLAQALGGRDELAAMIAEMPVSAEESWPDGIDREAGALALNAEPAFDVSPPVEGIAGLPDADGAKDRATGNNVVADLDNVPRRRSHGSASPR
jgi:hypothetical protein